MIEEILKDIDKINKLYKDIEEKLKKYKSSLSDRETQEILEVIKKKYDSNDPIVIGGLVLILSYLINNSTDKKIGIVRIEKREAAIKIDYIGSLTRPPVPQPIKYVQG